VPVLGGNKSEKIGNKKDLSTGGDFSIAVGKDMGVAVKGKGSSSYSKELDIGSEKTITIKAKDSLVLQSDCVDLGSGLSSPHILFVKTSIASVLSSSRCRNKSTILL